VTERRAVRRGGSDRAVTKSLCASPQLSRERDAPRSIVVAMDVVSILLGLVMFAILLLIIEGIDRI
jgi:hypothetical protein